VIKARVDYRSDDLYRLTRETRTDSNGDAGVEYDKQYFYDLAGNRTRMIVDSVQTDYTYDAANKMLTAGNSTFTYDDAGNTLTETNGSIVTAYTWDYLNRLTQWQKTGHTTQSYVYNADGMRVRVVPSGGTATDFLLDGIEIAEEMESGTVTSYVGPGLISQISDTTRTIYHADGLGSTRAMSGSSQVVSESSTYDAYGNAVATYGAAPSFGYVGQYRYYTDATGLVYLKARYYDSSAGRFISRDPIGYKGGQNLYIYCHDNPIAYIDPDGEFAWWIGCILPCGSAIGRPLIIAIGCLAGGATDWDSFKQCFGEMWCEEKGNTGKDAARCTLCLILAGAKALEPKLPPPWGTGPPPVERIPFPRVPLL
jgi:RHS repeat-associated protein